MTIHRFSGLDELKNSVQNDLKDFNISANRFPIRYIFLNSHEEMKEIIDLLIDNVTLIELSSFLYSNDSWLTPDQVINEINKLTDSSIIVPLSEYIRFLNDEQFSKIFNALSEIENRNLRLYIPLVGLWDRFEDLFWNKYYRNDNWAPIWKLDGSIHSIKIYQIGYDFNKDTKINNLKLILNAKEWFDLWKYDNVNNILSLCRPILINFKNSLPDQTFNQEIINNPKEYLSKLFDMDICIEYNPKEKEYWDQLLIDVSNINKKNISLRDIFSEKFNVSAVSSLELKDYLNYYMGNINTHYHQWIIKSFLIESPKYKNSYLGHCFKSMIKLGNNNLARKIFLEIFNLDYSEKYLEERRILLSNLSKYDFSFAETDFNNQVKKIENLSAKEQLQYLTTTTPIEKLKIVDIIQKNGVDKVISDLKTIFPDLYYYLNWNIVLNEDIQPWIIEYFKEYNKSKILNVKSEKLESLLSEKNNPDNFYNWYFDVHDNIGLSDENGYVIWVDALGAEWLPLLIYYLNSFGKNFNKRIKYKSLSSVNIPSATEFNKIDADDKISDLDEYIHKNHYNYPTSLLDEMDYIRDIAKKIVKIDSPRISIVSDHGFSFLCTKKFGCFKKYSFKSTKHEGRYVSWENNEDVANEDYMSASIENSSYEKHKYLVTLKHISLNNTPSHEVHGGATPEEVLVPFIILENDDSSIIDYEIISSKTEVNVSLEDELPITILPEPSSMPVAICNNETLPVSKENNQFIIFLNSGLSKGKQTITIKIDDVEVELEINIKKGGMEEEDYGKLFG